MLLHVADHATDYRAQLLRLLNDLGVETSYQDYIFYVYGHPLQCLRMYERLPIRKELPAIGSSFLFIWKSNIFQTQLFIVFPISRSQVDQALGSDVCSISTDFAGDRLGTRGDIELQTVLESGRQRVGGWSG